MKKPITVSNLTLNLWLKYVKPAALAAGIMEEVPAHDDTWGDYIILHTEEAAADEIAHCMYCACMNSHIAHGDYTSEAEARQMLYQLEVSMKYDTRHTTETVTALYNALSAMLNPETTEETTNTTEEAKEEETMFNNYTEAVTADVRDYIRDNFTPEEITEAMTDRDEFRETLNDDMWVADEVTGNGSGSYTFNRSAAREYVLADIDTVREALREFCVEADTIAQKFLDEDWEYFDVTARCYVLGQAIETVLDELEAA